MRRRPLEERFWEKVEKTDTCWLWTASTNKAGYGIVWNEPSMRLAHRVSLELAGRPVPDGLAADHLCRVRHCVNPDHLEPVTWRENVLRSPVAIAAKNIAKTHCVHGHPFSPDNTYVWTDQKGRTRRRCRTCMEGIIRRRTARRMGAAA